MGNGLERYLNDHLAGATGGLMLARHLAETATDTAEKLFFLGLKDKVGEDKDTLMEIIQALGFRDGKVRRAVGSALARTGIWRMDGSGQGFGDLGRFEMIELLAIGIHGKSLLWKTLHENCGSHHALERWNFERLEKEASHQAAGIERYRSREAMALFGNGSDPELSH